MEKKGLILPNGGGGRILGLDGRPLTTPTPELGTPESKMPVRLKDYMGRPCWRTPEGEEVVELPDGNFVQKPDNLEDRQALRNIISYQEEKIPRWEVSGLLAKGINSGINEFFTFLLTHFEMKAKTEEGEKVLQYVADRQKELEGNNNAEGGNLTG